jgi:hypothetical protein
LPYEAFSEYNPLFRVQRIVVRWTPGLTNLLHFYTTDRPIPKVSITPPPENDRVLAQSLQPLQRLMA